MTISQESGCYIQPACCFIRSPRSEDPLRQVGPLNLCRNEMPMNRPISDLNPVGEGRCRYQHRCQPGAAATHSTERYGNWICPPMKILLRVGVSTFSTESGREGRIMLRVTLFFECYVGRATHPTFHSRDNLKNRVVLIAINLLPGERWNP